MSPVEAAPCDADLLVLGGAAGEAEFAATIAARPATAAPGPDRAAWRELLRQPALREALDPDRDADDALRRLGALALTSGRVLAPVPLVDAAVSARALTRVGTSAALEAAGHIRAGDRWGALARVPLSAKRVLVPTASGVALAAPDGALVLLERSDDADPGLPGLAEPPGYAWDATGAVALADGPDGVALFACAVSEWRLLSACRLVGMMDGALALAREHATRRVQFDAPIGSFQAVAHQLATVAVLTEGLRTLVDETLANWGADPRRDQHAVALAVFLHAARVAPRVAEMCVHVHGGQGVIEASPAAGYLRSAKALAVAGGARPALYRELGRRSLEPDISSGTGCGSGSVRARARAFFGAMRDTDPTADASTLLPAMAREGLLGMTWTGEELRFDLAPAEHLAVAEEAMDAGYELTALTTTMNVAKTLAVVGSPEQQAAILPGVAAGKAIICLGYSEAEAGSDVASIRTRAVRDGDGWRITGAKLYTSRAHLARYVFLLTRTDPDVPKWRGLSMFLIPIDTPGIRVERLPLLSGAFSTATYYDDVRVPDDARVGEVNAGGAVMQIALQFEHGGGSVPGRTLTGPGRTVLARAIAVAAEQSDVDGTPLLDDPMIRAALVDHRTENEISSALERRSIRRAGATGATGPLASIVKLQAREAYQRLCADVLDLFGERAALTAAAEGNLADGLFEQCYRGAQAATIYGGTSEIQRTIIAERWLELPRGSRK